VPDRAEKAGKHHGHRSGITRKENGDGWKPARPRGDLVDLKKIYPYGDPDLQP
jgi:hypothetical protein